MPEHTFTYDDSLDTLLITFSAAERTTALALNEYVVLHLDAADQQVARITLCDYSLLINETKFGPRYFPLTGLSNVSNDTRTMVLDLLSQVMLSDILSLSVYVPSLVDTLPIISIKPVFPIDTLDWQASITRKKSRPPTAPLMALSAAS
jgi:hypothetical protein